MLRLLNEAVVNEESDSVFCIHILFPNALQKTQTFHV